MYDNELLGPNPPPAVLFWLIEAIRTRALREPTEMCAKFAEE